MKNVKFTKKELELIVYSLECQLADNKDTIKNRIWNIQDKIEILLNK